MALDADPYRTLGLARGATLDEVKRAYRLLAKINHPDAAGAGALPRFLAIQAAYERLAGGSVAAGSNGRGATAARPRPREPRPAAPSSRTGRATRDRGSGPDATDPRRTNPAHQAPLGKATLGSTSYDGVDGGTFEPDWGGASWYGTSSGTYWTINPKEYADPRKHGPEYQARARRASRPEATATPLHNQREARGPGRPADPTHTTSSWWDSTSGPADPPASGSGPAPSPEPASRRARPDMDRRNDEPAPDLGRAATDLGRALTDPRSGGLRGRVTRALLGWFPIAFGLGWIVGELSGCARFAARCDPSIGPLSAIGQGAILVALLFLPQLAALAAGGALVLLAAAVSASLALSATGTAADEGSRRAALGALLLVAWLSGLAIATVRRARSGAVRGRRSAGPVS